MATEVLVLELQAVLLVQEFPASSTKTTSFYGSQVFATAEYSMESDF